MFGVHGFNLISHRRSPRKQRPVPVVSLQVRSCPGSAPTLAAALAPTAPVVPAPPTSAACVYTSCYCEENVYMLAKQRFFAEAEAQTLVVFISNPGELDENGCSRERVPERGLPRPAAMGRRRVSAIRVGSRRWR